MGPIAIANHERPAQSVRRFPHLRVAPRRLLLHVPGTVRRPTSGRRAQAIARVVAMGGTMQADAVGRVDRVFRSVRTRLPATSEPLR